MTKLRNRTAEEVRYLVLEILGQLDETTEESAQYERAGAGERRRIMRGVSKYKKNCLERLDRILEVEDRDP